MLTIGVILLLLFFVLLPLLGCCSCVVQVILNEYPRFFTFPDRFRNLKVVRFVEWVGKHIYRFIKLGQRTDTSDYNGQIEESPYQARIAELLKAN